MGLGEARTEELIHEVPAHEMLAHDVVGVVERPALEAGAQAGAQMILAAMMSTCHHPLLEVLGQEYRRRARLMNCT